MSRFSCAAASAERHEPALGTASRIDRWLLVEAPGAWGPRALPESRGLDDATLLILQQRAKGHHARTLLIRRPGRPAETGGRWVFTADSRPGHESLLTRHVGDAELAGLELPFDGPVDGWDVADVLVGVCTHGRHDACCAVHGRLAVASIAARHPGITWETSHIGGDRFAANALVLPAGHYLGRLPAEGAADVLDRLLLGERPDPHYRGRSCWPPAVQAALSFAAATLDEPRLDALEPERLTTVGPRRWRVTVAHRGSATVEVEVEMGEGPESSLLSCRATSPHPVPRWHLVGIEGRD